MGVAVDVEPLELDPEPQLARKNKVARINTAVMACKVLVNP